MELLTRTLISVVPKRRTCQKVATEAAQADEEMFLDNLAASCWPLACGDECL